MIRMAFLCHFFSRIIIVIRMSSTWFKIADSWPQNADRIHTRIDSRYVTIFKNATNLSAIDAICYHAAGPLTLGKVQDIEELGMKVVLCPHHKYMVSVETGVRAYQGVDFVNGKPVPSGWKVGKVVQRPHKVVQIDSGIYLSLHITEEEVAADKDSCNEFCAQSYEIQTETVTPVGEDLAVQLDRVYESMQR